MRWRLRGQWVSVHIIERPLASDGPESEFAFGHEYALEAFRRAPKHFDRASLLRYQHDLFDARRCAVVE